MGWSWIDWQGPEHPCVNSNALLWVERWGGRSGERTFRGPSSWNFSIISCVQRGLILTYRTHAAGVWTSNPVSLDFSLLAWVDMTTEFLYRINLTHFICLFPCASLWEKAREEFSLLIWVMQLFVPKLQTVIRSDLMHDLTGCSVQMLLLQWTINDNGIINIHWVSSKES